MASSTGLVSLDVALGGGLSGAVINIFGAPDTGKSTLAWHVLTAEQKAGRRVALISTLAQGADPLYGARIGASRFPCTRFEDPAMLVATAADMLLSKTRPDLLVVELDTRPEDPEVAASVSRQLTSLCQRHCSHNRVAQALFVTPAASYQALKYYSSQRIQLRVEGEAPCGDRLIRASVVKNKCHPPFKFADLQLTAGDGFDTTADLIRAATLSGIRSADDFDTLQRELQNEMARENLAHAVRCRLLLTAGMS